MEKRSVFIALSVVMLVLGVLVTAFIPIIYGFIILYLLWAEQGGMSYGNPYRKRMLQDGKWSHSKSVLDPEVKKRKDDVEHDPAFFVASALGFANILFGIALVVLG